MLKPHGYVTVVSDRQQSFDSVTCGHCNQIVLTKPATASTVYLVPDPDNRLGPMKEEPGAMCRQCMRAICLQCYADGRCTPLMKRIEAMEAKGRMMAKMGLST